MARDRHSEHTKLGESLARRVNDVVDRMLYVLELVFLL